MRKLNLKSVIGCLLISSIALAEFTSCKPTPAGSMQEPPKITLDRAEGIYVVKVGKPITITPLIENDIDAFYSWTTSDGKIIGRDKQLTYTWQHNGEIYITLKVFTDNGSAEKEVRVDVAQLVPPTIAMTVPKGGFVLLKDGALDLTPIVDNADQATFEWKADDQVVATTQNYSFKSDKVGKFHLTLSTKNEDGADSIGFDVEVKSADDMPFSWQFQSKQYNVTQGRTIRLSPYAIVNPFDAIYTWIVDGKEVKKDKTPLYDFVAQSAGNHTIEIQMTNSYYQTSEQLTINVCAAEGTFKRAITQSSQVNCDKVYEYLPAPGQFINEGSMINTMSQACTFAQKQMLGNTYVSLGGFGGYLVVGFDHSVENDGGYNFQIIGNSFTGSSEAGIVYVMQDENGDGLPNDTWFELKGSEYGKPETLQNYEVTYFRPRASGMPVSWSDNQGRNGSIDYLAAYHRQDSYYPAWVSTASYTLRGSCLKSRTVEVNPGFWSHNEYEWGYADNYSSIDRLTGDNNAGAGANANHFKISDAVTFDGKAANLQYIDFVKIQTGINDKAGWLGEVSTEVFGARDYNMIKKK